MYLFTVGVDFNTTGVYLNYGLGNTNEIYPFPLIF